MTRITEDLVRKRAEHNDGCISDLKEITLHQFEIEKIENLGQLCRHLEILFLQNNLISKIENLQKLQELKYLNLAINNITKVENLEYCECLEKLDLTANFVDDLLSIASLAPNYNLKDLFLTGNPVTKHPKYRSFIIASVPSLKYLDGEEITKDERSAAVGELSAVRAQLEEEKKLGKHSDASKTAVEERVKAYKELAEKRGDNAPKDTPSTIQPIPPPPAPGETARGINQAKLDFKLLEDDDGNIVLDLACGKYLDTSLIEVDAQPNYVRVVVKGKLFQLPLPEEVSPDSGTARRSTITGNLVLTLPKAKQVLKSRSTPVRSVTPAPKKETPTNNTLEGGELNGTVDIRNIVQNAEKEKQKQKEAEKKAKVSEIPAKTKSSVKVEYDFDESEVPPLE